MEKAKAIAKENGAKYKCGLCGNKEFILESSYKQHVKRKHASDKPTCSECGKQFVSTTSLERHMKLHASLGCEQCRRLKVLNWKINQMMEEARKIQNHSC